MLDEEGNEVEFDVERVMAEITVAAPELTEFLGWAVEMEDHGQFESDEVKLLMEAVYSFAKWKNDAEEERMMDGRT